MSPFTNIRALIIDMDGVLWHGEQPLPGLIDFFKLLRTKPIPFILATNNASLSPDQYVKKLDRMGVAVDRQEILTSGIATAMFLAKQTNPKSTRIYVLGENGARQPLLERGFTLTDIFDPNDPTSKADIVVCGKDETVTWNKLADATLNIRAGARFIGTNADTTLPTERGTTHGNGAILAALEAATGIKPEIIGKPEPIMYQQALALLGTPPEETVAIGDRLETDILGAVRADIRSMLVLTGISSEDELNTIEYQPTWVLPDLAKIMEVL
ncbi:MAG: HAD-IIA family hydrolase [Methylococcaceae bacterium]